MLKLRKKQDSEIWVELKSFIKGILPRRQDILEEALNSLELALIYFDRNGDLLTANCRACELIPQLAGKKEDRTQECRDCKIIGMCQRQSQEKIKNYRELVSYIFDNSLDAQEQAGLLLESTNPRMAVFHEIISPKDGAFYIVRVIPQSSKGIIVELTDISTIKYRSDHLFKLNRENRILTEAIQTSRKGIFILENDTEEKRLIFANQAVANLLDIKIDDYIGGSGEVFMRRAFDAEWNNLQQVINGKIHKCSVWHHIPKENEDKWLELYFYKSGQEGNLLIGFLANQTQAKLQEDRLRQTQKLEAIGQLAGGVAHDFNNILAIIEGYGCMAQTAARRGESIESHLTKILQATQRGSGLTRQLLTFGKHRVGETRTINLSDHIQEIKTLLMPLLGVNVSLEIKCDQNSHFIRATTDIISQIVMNLSINARDAMPDGGSITISLETLNREDRGNGSLLRISDTGTGMSRDIMERMFDPFFTTKEQGKGTGLGLSMVYGLVQQINADMNVDSEIGKGTSFSIWFPESDAAPEINSKENREDATAQLLGKTVIVAEDEPELLELMQATLEGFGMKVMKAANGNEALELQDEYDGEIDFLLTDMVMPQLGGLELAELFKEVRPDTHIVFMSGYPVRGEISEIDLPDDVVFLAKPIMQENLKKIMEQTALGNPIQAAAGVVWEK
ncbi:MAG: ATP-binding protein [Pseudobdellovibrionaceae bacterium]|jgi:signal transduction histidine kinase/CheY-like chemotaxis protein|nr:ATP-binding protein [Pseudobdellovibrionaceae bacterium]